MHTRGYGVGMGLAALGVRGAGVVADPWMAESQRGNVNGGHLERGRGWAAGARRPAEDALRVV